MVVEIRKREKRRRKFSSDGEDPPASVVPTRDRVSRFGSSPMASTGSGQGLAMRVRDGEHREPARHLRDLQQLALFEFGAN